MKQYKLKNWTRYVGKHFNYKVNKLFMIEKEKHVQNMHMFLFFCLIIMNFLIVKFKHYNKPLIIYLKYSFINLYRRKNMMVEDKYNEACKLISNCKFTEAEYILDEILQEDEEYYKAINKFGVIYAEQGNLNKAEEYFNKALSVKENYVPSIVNLGNLFKENGELDKAEKYYIYAIQIDPEYVNSYYNLAVLYKALKNYPAYIKYIKEYKKHIKNTKYKNLNTYNKGGVNIFNFFKVFQKNI